jgi:hypothetical protein
MEDVMEERNLFHYAGYAVLFGLLSVMSVVTPGMLESSA